MRENVGQAAAGPGDVGLPCGLKWDSSSTITTSTHDGRRDVELLEALLPVTRQAVKEQ